MVLDLKPVSKKVRFQLSLKNHSLDEMQAINSSKLLDRKWLSIVDVIRTIGVIFVVFLRLYTRCRCATTR